MPDLLQPCFDYVFVSMWVQAHVMTGFAPTQKQTPSQGKAYPVFMQTIMSELIRPMTSKSWPWRHPILQHLPFIMRVRVHRVAPITAVCTPSLQLISQFGV